MARRTEWARGLTLCALSRTLPLDESEKMRSKRLYRLLRNAALDGTVMTPLLVRLALGPRPQGWIPIVVDQTTIHGRPVLMAGLRVAHRVLPVAFACYEYDTLRTSQNVIEQALLLLITACLPPGPSRKARISIAALRTDSLTDDSPNPLEPGRTPTPPLFVSPVVARSFRSALKTGGRQAPGPP